MAARLSGPAVTCCVWSSRGGREERKKERERKRESDRGREREREKGPQNVESDL